MNIANAEVEKFSALAGEWWDVGGPFAMLHAINPVRLDYIIRQINNSLGATAGLKILDIACGGGIVSLPLHRLGASVVGIDASAESIEVAKSYAASAMDGNGPVFYCERLESFAQNNAAIYDVVLMLEILEHVDDVKDFIKHAIHVLRPGGILILSTINRTLKSLMLAKLGAEYILRIVPAGTHDWNKFLKPQEVSNLCPLEVRDISGMKFSMSDGGKWVITKECDVNYFITFRKPT